MNPGDAFIPWRIFVGLFVPNALARYTGISAAAKLLYGRMSQYAGKDGDCHPKQESLAAEIGVSDRYVRKLLKELEDDGFIRVRPPEGKDRLIHKSSRYEFLWHVIFEDLEGRRSDSMTSFPERPIVPVRERDTVPLVYKELKKIHTEKNHTPHVKCVSDSEKRFEIFWALFPARDGQKAGREKAKGLFMQLSAEDQALLIEATRAYAVTDAVQRGIGILDPANAIRRRDRDTGEISEPWRTWAAGMPSPSSHSFAEQDRDREIARQEREARARGELPPLVISRPFGNGQNAILRDLDEASARVAAERAAGIKRPSRPACFDNNL